MLLPAPAPRRAARHAAAGLGLLGVVAVLAVILAAGGNDGPPPDPTPVTPVAATADSVDSPVVDSPEIPEVATASPLIWRDGPGGSGTGAVLVAWRTGPAAVEGRAGGIVVTDLESATEELLIGCEALGATDASETTGATEIAAAGLADPIVPLSRTDAPAAAVVRIGAGSGVCGGPPGLAVVQLDPGVATAMSTIATPAGTRAIAIHPDGEHVVIAADELTARRGTADVVDISDLRAPLVIATISLANGVASDDLVFSEDGSRLYAAAASHAIVLDTADPSRPTRLGTIADPLVRNYWRLDSWTVDDPLLGHRELLMVRSRIDGLACPMGMVHVYDITGDLFWEPAMVIDVDVPDALTTMRAETPLAACAEPVLRLQSASRTITIGFGDAHLPVLERLQGAQDRVMSGVLPAGRFPYDTTEEFRASLPRCSLVAA